MESFSIKLTRAQLAALDREHPRSGASAAIGKRAIELVKKHFRAEDPKSEFVTPTQGADLRVRGGRFAGEYEVKGTAREEITWSQLKVSSQKSHDRLSKGLTLIRVVDVYGSGPKVYFLKHGRDFTLQPEKRWSVKRVR